MVYGETCTSFITIHWTPVWITYYWTHTIKKPRNILKVMFREIKFKIWKGRADGYIPHWNLWQNCRGFYNTLIEFHLATWQPNMAGIFPASFPCTCRSSKGNLFGHLMDTKKFKVWVYTMHQSDHAVSMYSPPPHAIHPPHQITTQFLRNRQFSTCANWQLQTALDCHHVYMQQHLIMRMQQAA